MCFFINSSHFPKNYGFLSLNKQTKPTKIYLSISLETNCAALSSSITV